MINGAMHQEIAGVKYCYRIFENAAGCLGETAGSVFCFFKLILQTSLLYGPYSMYCSKYC